MRTFRFVFQSAFPALLALAIVTGCSAEAKKSRHLTKADRYFAAGEYEKAKIEYMNVLRADPQNATALQQLGIIWCEQGAPLRALPFLVKTRELSPGNLAARVKLARSFADVGGIAEARKEALAILQQSPAQPEALLLAAETARTEEETNETEQQLEKIPEKGNASFHLASATLSLRKKDLPAAESAVQRALAADPKSSSAHSAMATIYLFQKKTVEAGEEFKAAAELAPVRSAARLAYAEFKARSGAADVAKVIMKEVTDKAPDYLPAWRVLAQMAFAEKKYDESLKLIGNVLVRDPSNVETLVLQAEVWLAKGEVTKAVEGIARLDIKYPNTPVLKYQLGRAYLQNKNPAEAAVALNQAVAANPDYTEAILLLGEVNLRSGDAQAVVVPMVDLLKKRPNVVQAQLLLAAAYQALGRLDDAAGVYREQIKVSPQSPVPYLLLGLIQRQQNKAGEARKTFEKALELKPENLTAANQLVELDIADKDFTAAMQKAQRQIEKTPKAAGAYFLEGKTYAAQGEWDRAEAALLKTLDLDPEFSSAYDLLIATYIAANKLPQAVGQLEGLMVKNPGNIRALMTSAAIYEKMNDFSKAQGAYEKLIAVKPDSPMALNNLAYLYSERLNQLDKAYDVARKARALQPEQADQQKDNPDGKHRRDASIADTLGWILYKRGDYQQALALAQEAVGQLPEHPEVQYHLGMANYMMGQTEAARAAFQLATDAPADFAGKQDAHQRLALLAGGSGASKELSTDELEAILKQQPNDVVARMRLAESYEKQGAFAKAAAACDEALKSNPKLLSATTKLARLYAGPLQNQIKALEYAKKARELAPNDPQVGGVLGSVAYQIGNYSWAYSLLQESARQLTNDVRVLHDLAWAAYSMGKVSEAQQTMQRLLNAAPDAPESKDAKSFLAMTTVDQNSKDLAAAEPEVQKLLQADPSYVPALMAEAAIKGQGGDTKAATATYTEVLRRFPDFAPAQKHLASLYLEDPASLAKAYELAVKARKILPEDPELAQTLAGISYKRKEYAYAVQLLRESAGKKPLDAKSLFYLGMSHSQAKQKAEGCEALEQALAAGLQEPLATDARRTILELQRD